MQNLDDIYRLVKDKLECDEDLAAIEPIIREHTAAVRTRIRQLHSQLNKTELLIASQPDSPEKRKIYSHLLLTLGERFCAERLMIRARRNKVSLGAFPSFTSCMNRRSYIKQALKGCSPENVLINKDDGYNFAKSCGLQVPVRSKEPEKASTLPLRPGTVIKPVNSEGGRGVYIIHSESNIVGVKSGERIDSLNVLRERIIAETLSKWVREDSWMWEEIIYENRSTHVPARDLKFYCFYGKCALVLEVIRFPRTRFAWWDYNKKPVATGKYKNMLFPGEGFSDEYLEVAQWVSQLIPAPFIRIDFLRSEKGPVLGEFTGHPGSYERFDRKTDNMLGKYYVDAEQRLLRDCINGKQFSYFRDYFRQ